MVESGHEYWCDVLVMTREGVILPAVFTPAEPGRGAVFTNHQPYA